MEVESARAEELRAKYGAKRAYTDEEALLNDPEVDAVYIASPVFLHAKQAMMAADHGKHILLEKPIASTPAEAEKVLDYCDAKGVRVAAGFMMRFGACINRMKEAYEAGIDSLEEYAQKKAKITAELNSIRGKAQQSAPAPVNIPSYKKKVLKVLDIIKDDSTTEAAKNAALKSIISYIVYEKQNHRLAIYFYT